MTDPLLPLAAGALTVRLFDAPSLSPSLSMRRYESASDWRSLAFSTLAYSIFGHAAATPLCGVLLMIWRAGERDGEA